mmetsp:Transcript_6830/g.15613  ORF Transcript_6830/g.15613 Transcript_6830/m.15613 type:complete len:107 (+) Transcript_6830:5426-5746(+)
MGGGAWGADIVDVDTTCTGDGDDPRDALLSFAAIANANATGDGVRVRVRGGSFGGDGEETVAVAGSTVSLIRPSSLSACSSGLNSFASSIDSDEGTDAAAADIAAS